MKIYLGAGKYYVVQIEWEFLVNNEGAFDTRITRAGRLRPRDYNDMLYWLEWCRVEADIVPTGYKPWYTEFINPKEWAKNHGWYEGRYFVKNGIKYVH